MTTLDLDTTAPRYLVLAAKCAASCAAIESARRVLHELLEPGTLVDSGDSLEIRQPVPNGPSKIVAKLVPIILAAAVLTGCRPSVRFDVNTITPKPRLTEDVSFNGYVIPIPVRPKLVTPKVTLNDGRAEL